MAKEVLLFSKRFQIGMLAVLALVALRLSLGFHFLYEGVWKIKHRDEFTAEPFLTLAKGPVSPLFYMMIDDIDGRRRLQIITDESGAKSIDASPFLNRWKDIQGAFIDFYAPESSDEAATEARQRLEKDTAGVMEKYEQRLDRYLKSHAKEVIAHFESLDRFENDPERHQSAPFQKKLRWDRMMELRAEVNRWIGDLEAQETALKNSFYDLLEPAEKEKGQVPASWNPFYWSRIEQINFAVTYSLTAMGICLMLGFFTPLAALGGAGFMCFVVLTQPAFPGIYPPDPPVVGHALLVNKDFVEMVALLVVAAASAGRWGGLDFFLYRWFVNPIMARFCKEKQ